MGRANGRTAAIARAGVVLLAGAFVAACGDDEPNAGPPPTPAARSASPGGSRPPLPDLGSPRDAATGLEVPWGLAFLPDGDALVSERDNARVLRIPAKGGSAREVYRVPGVVAQGEGGLLGIAVSPNYERDQFVYAYFTAASDNRIVRFRLDDDEPRVIFSGIAKAGIHNGGRIAFGPDGHLYVGTGDAGNPDRSQDRRSPNGKILRLTPDGEPAPGNPAGGSPVYSLGHRNVQGLAWDSDERLYATEFGQNRFDEVNVIESGGNYGWPEVEGEGDTDDGRFTNPVVVWGTDESSPSGAAVVGDTLYVAALRGQRLWTVPLDDGKVGEARDGFRGEYGRLRTVVTAPDGSLWLATSNRDGRGNPRDGDDRIIRFPAG